MGCIREYIEKNYSDKRKKHTYGVYETAVTLARRYGADEGKAGEAALFHDLFKGAPEQTLNCYLEYFNMDDRYHGNANLAHGKIAAAVMERDHGITDYDVLNAVRFHTTGRAGMSTLEKIIYLADSIEPGRDYPGVEEIRALAYKSLDEACILLMERTIEHVNGRGLALDNDTVSAMEYLNGRLNKRTMPPVPADENRAGESQFESKEEMDGQQRNRRSFGGNS